LLVALALTFPPQAYAHANQLTLPIMAITFGSAVFAPAGLLFGVIFAINKAPVEKLNVNFAKYFFVSLVLIYVLYALVSTMQGYADSLVLLLGLLFLLWAILTAAFVLFAMLGHFVITQSKLFK
jgi:hypothetical protein